MSRIPILLTQRDRMSRYYGFHSAVYDATRWTFLFDRTRIIQDLLVRPGETMMEIGCGTGHNFAAILSRVEARGKLIAVDCSAPMLRRAASLARRRHWSNVELIDQEYGLEPVHPGQTDVILMSYSLSMMPNWQKVLKCAKAELRPGGRIGIVDFCSGDLNGASEAFGRWLRLNHVEIDHPYENVLMSMFYPVTFKTKRAFGGLWKYFRFAGQKQ